MNQRPHTYRPYGEELKALRDQILEMGGFVEKQIGEALSALVLRDSELARERIALDHEVNRMDVEIDELCIRLLALHQPTARDLRLITTGLKITTDLERIGDLATNICERTLELNEEPQLKPFIDIPHMADIAQRMLRQSLDAFLREDTELALMVCGADDTMDHLNDQLCRELLSYMAENPQTVSRAVRLSCVAKYFERIGDHATNIAEMVIFMVKGTRIRHLDPVPKAV